MKPPCHESIEILNAFVDDELDAEERQAVLNSQVDDPKLAETICELRVLKDLVRAARPDSETQTCHASVPKHNGFNRWWAVASVFFALITVFASTFWMSLQEADIASKKQPTYQNVADLLQQHSDTKYLKMVLHITTADSNSISRLFQQLEQLVAISSKQQRDIQVQVIASEQGVNFLQTGYSPYQDKIKYFSERYDMIEFIACQRSIMRQTEEHKKNITLLPEALITHSGLQLIKRRQKQGWATIVI